MLASYHPTQVTGIPAYKQKLVIPKDSKDGKAMRSALAVKRVGAPEGLGDEEQKEFRKVLALSPEDWSLDSLRQL